MSLQTSLLMDSMCPNPDRLPVPCQPVTLLAAQHSLSLATRQLHCISVQHLQALLLQQPTQWLHEQVTPHSDEENFPAGLHPLQEQGATGLEQWTAQVQPAACVLHMHSQAFSSVCAGCVAALPELLWAPSYVWTARVLATELCGLATASVCSEQCHVLQDRDLRSKDLVLWHSFGVTHVPR